MALPQLTDEQRKQALEKAAAARHARAELREHGKAKAAKIMDELGISATRRVQGLGVRQREQLLEQLTK
mgnify:CR=1 FL=1